MKNLLSLTAMTALTLAACAPTQEMQFTLDCASTQVEKATITYGASELKVDKPVLDVRRNYNFQLYLDPRAGYEGKNVTVVGVPADARWVAGRGNKSKAGMAVIEICVPGNTFVDQQYKYSVFVQDVGMLDPRVKVIE